MCAGLYGHPVLIISLTNKIFILEKVNSTFLHVTGYRFQIKIKINKIFFKIISMDCTSPSFEPQAKVTKIAATHAESRRETKVKPSSLTPNIVQRIKLTLAADNSNHDCKTRSRYQEVADNLVVFDLDGVEYIAVNAALSEIASWKPQRIPYLCLPVRNPTERRNTVIRTGTMLASLSQLTPCVIGIKIDSEACAKSDSKYHQLTELRRSLWHFLLSEISFLPPHLRTFLETELQIEAKQFKQEEEFKLPSINNVLHPRLTKKQVKIFKTK